MTEQQHETAAHRSRRAGRLGFPARLAAVGLALSLFGCKEGPTQSSPAPVEEPAAELAAPALKTWPAEAIEATGTWVCPPTARADEPGFKVGDPRYRGEHYEVLWISDDEGFRSRSLQDQGGKWQWQKGDYYEEISWFAHSFPGVRSVHHYVCTRVPGDNHWCKLLLSPSQGENGYSLELLDLLEPAHKDKGYDYQRIANRPLDEDEVMERVGLLKQAALKESEPP
jgi:hypothetical protein